MASRYYETQNNLGKYHLQTRLTRIGEALHLNSGEPGRLFALKQTWSTLFFQQASLEQLSLYECFLTGARWIQVVLNRPEFVDVHFKDSFFMNVRLEQAVIRKSSFRNCVWNRCEFPWEKEALELGDLSFQDCVFMGCSIPKTLRDVYFSNCLFIEEEEAQSRPAPPQARMPAEKEISPKPEAAPESGRFGKLEI